MGAERYARILVEAGRGASEAKNRALVHIRSEVVAFLDDDCVADRTWINAILARFEARGPTLGGVTGVVLPTRPGLYLVRPEPHPRVTTFRRLTESVPPWKVGGGLNVAFRVEALRRIEGFDPQLGPGSRFRAAEELDVFCRLLTLGYEIDYDPEVLLYHEPLDRFSQIARMRYGYRLGLGAFFAKHRRDPVQSRIFRSFLATELHDAKIAASHGQPGLFVLAALGVIGLVGGRLSAALFLRDHGTRLEAEGST